MGECVSPITIMNKETPRRQVTVPCGKCLECLKKRISAWSFRLMNESKQATTAHFITLTYDTKHVPITKNGFMEIKKRDVQLFFKRLRKSHKGGTLSIKYYAVGEYGGKTKRPHYHVILFNAELELIQPAWNLGQVHYGKISEASVGYTLKYISKPSKIPMHRNDDRTPEFSLMSKGLGTNYLTDKMIKWHQADPENRMYCNILDGKKVTMPRYYKEQIFTEEQRKSAAEKFLAESKQKKKETREAAGDKEYYRNQLESIEAMRAKQVHTSKQERNKI